jgi:hypothetical protein
MSLANIILVTKPEGKRLLGRPRQRWKGHNKTDLKEMEGVCLWGRGLNTIASR